MDLRLLDILFWPGRESTRPVSSELTRFRSARYALTSDWRLFRLKGKNQLNVLCFAKIIVYQSQNIFRLIKRNAKPAKSIAE